MSAFFRMKPRIVAAICLQGMIWGCGPKETVQEQQRSANTTAGKVGQMAQKAAAQANKASQKIGQEIKQSLHEAHAGWKESARKNKEQK